MGQFPIVQLDIYLFADQPMCEDLQHTVSGTVTGHVGKYHDHATGGDWAFLFIRARYAEVNAMRMIRNWMRERKQARDRQAVLRRQTELAEQERARREAAASRQAQQNALDGTE